MIFPFNDLHSLKEFKEIILWSFEVTILHQRQLLKCNDP